MLRLLKSPAEKFVNYLQSISKFAFLKRREFWPETYQKLHNRQSPLNHVLVIVTKPMFCDSESYPWRGWFFCAENNLILRGRCLCRYASLIDFPIAKKECFQFFNFTSNLLCRFQSDFARFPPFDIREPGLPLWDFNLKILHCIKGRAWWVYHFAREGIRDWLLFFSQGKFCSKRHRIYAGKP